ncbi:MAG TPA: STAS domain-containing protein [Gemmatimonadaceae bacterium]|nr:STAS domain-containing protein [Gemmatimonadaceae bacterium]
MSEQIRIVAVGDARHLHLHGTVGVFLADELLAAARTLGAEARDVVVRCERLEHLDASAAQTLLALRKRLVSLGRVLLLADVPAAVARYLRLGALDAHLPATDGVIPPSGA